MSGTIEYPIAETYINNWNLNHALRELVANAIDQGDYSLEYKQNKDLIITNKNVVLKPETLLLGISEKHNDNAIGQYGEGLKLALFVLTRLSYEVKVFNGKYQNWTPIIAPSERFNANVFKIKIREVSGKRPNDFVITISNIEHTDYLKLLDTFLELSKPTKVIETSRGQIIEDILCKGHFYVRGVFVTEAKHLGYGYNFYNLDTGRDRQIPNLWDMQYEISQMWSEVSFKNKKVLFDIFDDTSKKGEIDGICYAPSRKMTDALVDEFISRYDEDTVAVTNVAEAEELKHLGIKSQIVHPQLAKILHYVLPSPEKVKQKLNYAIEKRYNIDEIDETALNWLFKVADILKLDKNRIVICKFKSDKIEGLHQDNYIYISINKLNTIGGAIQVLIHEFAHDFGPDGTKEHTDAIAQYTEKVLNELCK